MPIELVKVIILICGLIFVYKAGYNQSREFDKHMFYVIFGIVLALIGCYLNHTA